MSSPFVIGNARVFIFENAAALARNAADRFVALAQESIAARGHFAVALSGGATPRALYKLLATPEFSARIEWARAHLFWGDERAVPPDHRDSNFKMANDALIARAPIPPANVHRLRGELPPADAAREYEQILRACLPPQKMERIQMETDADFSSPRASALIRVPDSSFPRLDLILLGLGADGHTASLFPHAAALREESRTVVAPYIEKLRAHRLTLTAPTINAARHILFLVAGAGKAEMVRAVLRGDYRPDDLPAQMIQPANGECVWLLDQAAAILL